MEELQIKHQSLATRCEICHKSDRFDPTTNYCARCAGINVQPTNVYSNSRAFINAVNEVRYLRTFGIGALISSGLMLFSAILGFDLGAIGARIFLAIVVTSIAILCKGGLIFKLLRKEGQGDPDWLTVRKRATTAMVTGGTALFLSLGWGLVVIANLSISNNLFSEIRPTRRNFPQLIRSNYRESLKDVVIRGDAPKVEWLLNRGADVNEKDNAGNTALMYAVQTDHPDIAWLLCQSGADVNLKDVNGLTALMYAAINGNAYTVNLLLEEEAEINATNNAGYTALAYAIENGNKEAEKLLRQAGAKQ
ncbi:MAG: ankyrin repeat domain-containing protein [Acidobacteriota bacterium]